MENLNTDNLMRMQVEQLEKEKKELNERMRIIAKRLDHVERAYRRDERPLLSKDYEVQQANDKEIFEAAQKFRLEDSRAAHQQALETKKRLSRMMNEYNARKELILSKRGEEYAAKQAAAQKKIEEEKAKRRATVLKAREEERLREEEEERIRREKEAEEARLEAGMYNDFYIGVLSFMHLQSASLRKNVVQQRKPLLALRRKPRRRKRRRKLQRAVANVRKNELLPPRKHGGECNAKKRPQSVLENAKLRLTPLRARPLPPEGIHGDGRPAHTLLPLLLALRVLPRPLLLLFPSTVQVLSVARMVDGEVGRQRKKLRVELPLPLDLPLLFDLHHRRHGLLPRSHRVLRKRMDSRLLKRRSGAPQGVAVAVCSLSPVYAVVLFVIAMHPFSFMH